MMYDHWDWMGFGGVWMLLFLGLVVVGIIAVVKYVWDAPGNNGEARASAALQILEERYARGEIDSEQFRRQKRELRE